MCDAIIILMTYSQLISKIYFLSTSNSTSYPIADLTIEANNALERVASLILRADGRWQWDDSNQTDLPIGTTALVQDQQDYAIPSTDIRITRLEVKDSSGNWQLLRPLDQKDLYNTSLTDFLKTSGVPIYYDKIGNSIFLYPKPNYAQAASLKVYFQRGPSLFLTSDTTKTPGFNSLYHDLIALWPAYNYSMANGLDQADRLMKQILTKEEALQEDYALRGKDENLALRPRRKSFR